MKYLFTYLSLLLVLSACGGGGGGGGGGSSSIPSSGNQPAVGAQTAFTGEQTINRASLSQNTQALLDVARQSGSPVFGSVMQAYTSGSSPSAVDTSFNGNRFTLQIRRSNGSVTTLDTNQDPVEITGTYTSSTNPVTGRPAVDGYMYRSNNSEITAAGTSVEWSNTDFTDYVAGGYWAHIDLNSQFVEIGAFIDGPNYGGTVDVPATGTATYNGRAGGGYLLSCGSDCELPTGTLEQGEYGGELRLVASFANQSISGSIQNIDLFNITAIAPDSTVHLLMDNPSSGYQLTLGPASINQVGQFTGNSITLTNPMVSISSSGGSWAGRFSTVDDSTGDPRAVVGTHRGFATFAGGSQAVFIGAQYGATERFQ